MAGFLRVGTSISLPDFTLMVETSLNIVEFRGLGAHALLQGEQINVVPGIIMQLG